MVMRLPEGTLAGALATLIAVWGVCPAHAEEEPPLPQGLEVPSEDEADEPDSEESSADEAEASEDTSSDSNTVAPPLPHGLEATDEPEPPAGLQDSDEPTLPSGLAGPEDSESGVQEDDDSSSPRFHLDVAGFWEARFAPRVVSDPLQEDFVLGEGRLQMDAQLEAGPATFTLVTDFYADAITDQREVDLDLGDGAFDLREANVLLRPFGVVDVKLGRQVLTWGVGDLLFINDLFPKDFVSFFSGRDVEYLKAPSDALKFSVFTKWLNVDLIFTARFDPDRFVDGDRLSFFNSVAGQRVGGSGPPPLAQPDRWIQDGELHARVYRSVGAWELAAYAYRGYWKSPLGVTNAGELTFHELSAYGASARGPLAGGLLSLEGGYYDSREDRGSTNPAIPNSQGRALTGFEREFWPESVVGVQYYVEVNQNVGSTTDRHLLTLRVQQRLLNQDLTVGVFLFVSPDQHDGYVRPQVQYKVSDAWRLEAGGNVFFGPRIATPFGQLHPNSSVYGAVRSSF